MAPRPTWQGHLRLSLVTCPVALYTATNPGGEVRFNLLHPKTHNRIRMVATDPDLGPVERSDLVKGYEVEKDRYVIVTPEEIDSVRLESTRTIDIERFVDVADIDRLYWDNPYFLVPDGKLAVEAYSVIRDAMAGAKRIALGRVVMHTRERLLAIEPRGKGLVAYSLRSYDEVRDPADLFDDIPAKKADPAMIAIARKIIEQQDGPFEPKDFKDRYEEALRELIKRKEKGGKTKVAAAPPEDTNVVDLMEALRKSLGGKAPAAKAPARKAAAKKTASARTKKAS
ncbi:Ku protein [Caulobacter flavus]|uniref:Non-homologous end joining protein Ku n=1 Tax=Caulobacter flavus TaxID=1679497 RepID=A0A2N5CWW3_9CAUL|nr:Ku protein [Caulobacter flavus]AYV47456.1 Ku protein [Caulobacter flavus]PLR18299.1 Ku protein [Caulobacter flavus]